MSDEINLHSIQAREREVHCIDTYTLSALFPASMMFSSSPGERFSCFSTFTTSALWA